MDEFLITQVVGLFALTGMIVVIDMLRSRDKAASSIPLTISLDDVVRQSAYAIGALLCGAFVLESTLLFRPSPPAGLGLLVLIPVVAGAHHAAYLDIFADRPALTDNASRSNASL